MGTDRRQPLHALRDDATGFALIEVVVSALLLTLVATGVYFGLDGASATSGVNKHRTQATAIAQQDQDRMRAMTVAELSNYRETQTTAVGGVTFSVRSSATWITDSTGSASCTSGQAGANYLRIASTVTWPSMHIAPVAVESLVAPPAGSFGPGFGSLAVQVNNGAGTGVPGVTASLTGARSYTDVTNENGCVLWAYLPVGTYNVAISKPSYVDPNLIATPTKSVSVVSETTVTLAFDYDVAGSLNVAYETLSRYDGTVTPLTATGNSFMLEASGLSAPLGPTSGGSVGALYPYSGGYAVYAGTCAGAKPASPPTVVVRAGTPASATVRLPPVDVRVMNGSSTALSGASVVLTGTGTGCSVQSTRRTGSDGYLSLAAADRAYPYGTYNVCVFATISGTRWTTSVPTSGTRTAIRNDSARGVANSTSTTFNLSSSNASRVRNGACP